VQDRLTKHLKGVSTPLELGERLEWSQDGLRKVLRQVLNGRERGCVLFSLSETPIVRMADAVVVPAASTALPRATLAASPSRWTSAWRCVLISLSLHLADLR